MADIQSKFPALDALTSLASDDLLVASDTSANSVAKKITTTNLISTLGINDKAPIADPTFTGEIGIGSVNVSETELGILEGATLTTTELNYVDGVTSAIQTQLNAKGDMNDVVDDITPQLGGDLDMNGNNITGLTASRAMQTNGSGVLEVSAVTETELNYLDGVTSAIQTQLDAKGVGDALTTNPLSQFASTTSAQLAGVISNETGTGALVFAASPTLVTPALGTPSALVGTNITGTASGLTAGTVTTNANLTGEVTSSGNATTIANNIVDEANMKISNAPTNDYVLTADSGATGGWKWASAGGGGIWGSITGTLSNQTDLQNALDAKAPTTTKLDDWGTPDDNTDLNATNARHGLLLKLNDNTSNFLRGDGTWATPAGSGNVSTSGSPVDDDFAKFVNGTDIEGRSYAEVKTDLSLNNVENTAISTWAGSSNITTVGTIGTGVWQGDDIAVGYLDGSSGTNTQVLTSDGTNASWQDASGGGTPGGSDTQIQYNNSGSFGGITNVTTDGSDIKVLDAGKLKIGTGSDGWIYHDSNNIVIESRSLAGGNLVFKDIGTVTGTFSTSALTLPGNLYLSGSNKELRFYEGANYVGFEAPALTANQIWVLPTVDGTANQVLKTDGSGSLGWTSAGSGTVDTSGTPVANDFARFTDADTIEGRSYSEVRTDLGLVIGTDVLAEQTIGIADNNLVEIDGATVANGEYAKFTANGLESKSYAEVRTDINVEDGSEANNISDANATDLTDTGDSTLHYHATDRARANHTGTQTASTISDFDTEVSNNSSVTANTAKNTYPSADSTKVGYLTVTQAVDLDTMESNITTNNAKVTNATHTGEVTGATALTIADNIVDEANMKISNAPTNDYVLTADSTATGGWKWASAGGGASQLSDLSDVVSATNTNKYALMANGTTGYVGRALVEADISDLGSYITASSTNTLTNKTFDANGTGNSLSNVDLANDMTGNLPVGNLNSGTSASSSTFWRGDGTWATPASSTAWGDITGTLSNQTDLQNALNAKQATLTFGIANNNAVEINSTSVANGEYAKFTLNGLESKSYAEVKTDLSLDNVQNVDTTNASNITSGTLSSSVLPPVALTEVSVVVNEAAQLALVAEEGDVAVRSDENKSYMNNGGSAGSMADWTELQTPTDLVLSVNGDTGTVVLNQDDVADGTTYVQTENNFTDILKTKLDGIEALAEVNNISDVNATDLTDAGDSTLHYHATDRARANHTGTQTASTISNFDTEVGNNSAVTANTAKNTYPSADATKVGHLTVTQAVNLNTIESDTATNNAKVTNATHTGEVTGATALTIANNVVDEANMKISNAPTNDYVLTADSVATGGWKWAAVSSGAWGSITGTLSNQTDLQNALNAKQATLTFGIANDNAVEIDDVDAASGDYAKFTANGLQGRSTSEVKTDLSLNSVENTAISSWTGTTNVTTLGTIGTGTWQGTDIGVGYIDGSSGTNTQVLTSDGTNASWQDASGGMSDLVDDTTPQLGGDLDTNAHNIQFDDTKGIQDDSGNELITFSKTASAVNEITVKNNSTTNAPEIQTTGGDTNIDLKLKPKGTGIVKGELKRFMVQLLAHDADQAAATTIAGDFRISNKAITIKDVGAYCDTAGTTGTFAVDINEAGTTILSTKITVDSGEKSSETAATAPVISDSAIAADAIITFDLDSVQTTVAKGLKVWVDYIYT